MIRARQWLAKYERYLMPAVFIGGFIIDNLTLTRIDLLYDNLVLFSYLVAAAAGIVLINLGNSGKVVGSRWERVAPWAPLLVQFAFGGLFSGFVIFYARSASLVESWPFILILVGIFVGNEFFTRRYQRFSFHLSVFFLALFSYLIFFLPVVLKDIGAHIFLLSGVVSVIVMLFFVQLLSRLIPERVARSRRAIFAGVGGVFALVNLLYFTNSIPPIPLSLKDIGVYHSVARTAEGEYLLAREKREWYELHRSYSSSFHRAPSEAVHVWSSVFAPTDLNTTIFHEWQYFDETRGEWTTTDRFSYPIVGGRDGGYRGFTWKTNVWPGAWRVNVVNKRGQILGRVIFFVADARISPPLETVVR